MVKVGIVGALGYGGGELVRILAGHPKVQLAYLSSELEKSLRMADVLPNLRGFLDAECEVYDAKTAARRCDVLFVAQHSGWAMREVGQFLDAGLKVIDLGADFRLSNPAVYEQWYEAKHESPGLIKQAVYGLPEMYRDEISVAQLVANPGCYPTGAILALAPLLKEKLVDPSTIIIDSKSGASGAGRSSLKLDYHFPELNQSAKAYNIGVHRHTPEIEQELSRLAGESVVVSFTPHLIPVTRGILTTAYAKLVGNDATSEDLLRTYREFYQSSPFVVTLDPGSYPATKDTFSSNFCHIGLSVDARTNRVVVVSALDNLVKGMAGAAVQNMNLMHGFDEKAGLEHPGIFP